MSPLGHAGAMLHDAPATGNMPEWMRPVLVAALAAVGLGFAAWTAHSDPRRGAVRPHPPAHRPLAAAADDAWPYAAAVREHLRGR